MSKRRRWQPRSRATVVILAAAAVIAVGCVVAAYVAFGGGDGERRSVRQEPVVTDEREVTVNVIDRDYDPRDLTIRPGATITWVWDGELPHNVVEDRGRFESPLLRHGDQWSLTFDDVGEFYYYCTLHHVMQGTIRVVE